MMGEGITLKNRLARWCARILPRRVLYFAVVRARHEAEQVQCPRTDSITASQMLSLLHVIMRDRLRVDRF